MNISACLFYEWCCNPRDCFFRQGRAGGGRRGFEAGIFYIGFALLFKVLLLMENGVFLFGIC